MTGMVIECPFLLERRMNMRKKNIIKTSYCKGCIWLVDGRLCPFLRCVRGYGWVAEKKAKEGQKNGSDEARN